MSFFGKGFAGGLAAGAAMGRSWVNTYNEADDLRKKDELAKESKALSKKMEDSTVYKAKEEGGGALAMPDQNAAQNYADYNNKIAAEDEQTFGGGLSSAPRTTVNKEQTYSRADYYADMGKKASGLGLFDKAEVYSEKSENIRDKEWQRGRLEKSDKRAEESHSMTMDKGKIDLDRAKADEESRKRIDGFNTALSDEYAAATKSGKPMMLSRIKALAAEHKLKPAEMLTAYSSVVGMDEAETGAVLAARARIAKDAARGGLENMLQVYETNPLFADGLKLEIKRGKDGQVTLMQDGKKLFAGGENGAMGYMLKWVVDPMSAFEYDAQVRTSQLQQRKTESEIGENNAQASSALANAAKTRAEAGVLKAGGGNYKVEANEVSAALGKPALDERGRPITDDYGMQKFIRNPDEESRFYKWMRDNNIRDTNRAIAIWKGGARDTYAAEAEKSDREKIINSNVQGGAVEQMRNKFGY